MSQIPKCMSTQHPDNVNSPFFAESTELDSEDEIQEAYDYKTNKKHKEITDNILEKLKKCNDDNLSESILRAAHVRKFLG